jgi:NAD(P)-dependent dehydrogenase (short-subunit alcohol dehydrogenase family)
VPHPNLKDTHVVIFGGSSGLGLAAAAAAKAGGAAVTLIGRSPERLALAAQSLGGARTQVADIMHREQVEAALSGLGRIDHLVITAGGFAGGDLMGSDPDHLLRTFQVVIGGALYAIRAALPAIPLSGSIVLTGGLLSERPAPGMAVLSAAVRAIEALAVGLALELKPIRVNVVSPGFVDTPQYDVLAERRGPFLAEQARKLPGGRIGRAEEVGDAVMLLLCNGYMNGEVLHIDGAGRFV